MINVYWAPFYSKHPADPSLDIYYGKLEHGRKEFMDNLNDDLGFNDNFLNCPSFNDLFKNIVLFSNMSDAYARVVNGQVIVKEADHDQIQFNVIRRNTLKNRVLVSYQMSWILFADKPLKMSTSSPYLHENVHTSYGHIIPGMFDIGSWFRPINLEYSLNENNDEIFIPAGDPLIYLHFHTDEKIQFHRFEMDHNLQKIALSVLRTRTMGNFSPLRKAYKYFNDTHLKGLILKNIRHNLLDPTE